MLNRVPLAELAESVATVARELRLVAHDDTISQDDLRALEACAARRLQEESVVVLSHLAPHAKVLQKIRRFRHLHSEYMHILSNSQVRLFPKLHSH